MKRYYFDLIDGETVTDVRGALLDGEQHAKAIGLDLARRVRLDRPELRNRGFHIVVRNEDHDIILNEPIDRITNGSDGGSAGS